MDHHEAVQRGAVEKYLLGELSPEDRDAFEEHYFGCEECAADLKAAAAFLEGAKQVLASGSATNSQAARARKSRYSWLWRPSVLSPAFSFLLLIIAYQNIVVLPRLSADAAAEQKPELLSSLSLIGANSRGGSLPTVSIAQHQALLLLLDIPSDTASDVSCELVSPSGAVVARVPVRAEAAKDTVAIRIPAAAWYSGDYTLIVQRGSHADPLARYRFSLIVNTNNTLPST
jgi:anti-sigma factor RsiW